MSGCGQNLNDSRYGLVGFLKTKWASGVLEDKIHHKWRKVSL
jgi:hypothetical protein